MTAFEAHAKHEAEPGAPLLPEASPARIKGEVRFVAPGERIQLHGSLAHLRLLTVHVPHPPWFTSVPAGQAPRVKLRDAIDAAIENVLETAGARPAGVGDLADLDQSLSDQLFRARSVGAGGLVLHLPNLSGASNLAGALDAEDSAVLRWWVAAATERPIVLLLDAENRRIGAYGPPTRLEHLIEEGPNRASTPQPAAPLESRPEAAPTEIGGGGESTEPAPVTETPARAPTTGTIEAPRDVPRPSFIDRVVPLFPRRESAVKKPSLPLEADDAPAAPSFDWRGFAHELALARGPKPLTFVERLFMTRYVPLVEAIARGEADPAARRTVEQWAEDFSRSYTEGFSALKVTGKRPRMVLDAPQLANQLARLHGARSTQLVLVDAMRFDLGVRVHDRMCDALTSQATCTERLLLWSALPTTTPAQLELLAHGPEGLATQSPPSEREEPGLRGRAHPTLRRIKLGSRDVMKLDTVQVRIQEAGPPLSERLDALADDVAATLAAHARSLAPRTVMFVFGDHGFCMESSDTGTLVGTSGGASPEEVLVPAFAWLVGDVH